MTEKIVCRSLDENCYIVYENGDAVCIDPGDCFGDVCGFLDEAGLKLHAVLLTHSHYDHIGSADEIGNKYRVPVICSEEEATLLNNKDRNLSEMFGCPTELNADKTFSSGDELTFGSIKLKAVVKPGHTAGSTLFFYGDVIFTGDTVFKDGFGRTDFPTGNVSKLRESVRYIFSLDKDYLLCPGHGDSVRLFDLLGRYGI